MSLQYAKASLPTPTFLSHVITITSETGVGSTSTIKEMQEKGPFGSLLWRYMSGGAIMRAFAEERGMTIEEFAAYNHKHPEKGYDAKLDKFMQQYGMQNRTIAEGRLTHVFIPHAFHVRLICPIEVRAKRRQADLKKPLEVIIREMQERDFNDNERYKQLYPGCLWPNADFDLVIDTDPTDTPSVVRKISEGHRAWCSSRDIIDQPSLYNHS